MVRNDTGISHVAAVVKTPSVTLFLVPESNRWAPKNAQLHRRIWQAMHLDPGKVLPVVEEHLDSVSVWALARHREWDAQV
jgi:ADP-heptose:LPS heptosyltransferase